jgi:hypothetical protein
MAFEGMQGVTDGTRVAGADLSSSQYKFVKLDSNGKVVVCSGATDKPYGVLVNNPKSGATASVVIVGVTKVQADAALATPGTLIGTSADGQADAKVPGTDTTEFVVGQTIGTAGAAGELVTVVVNCASPARAA